MADWLVANERPGSSQATVSRYVGGFSASVLSSAFGTAPGAGSDFNCQRRFVWQATHDTIYCVLWDGLYRSTNSGSTFTQVLSFPSPHADADDRLMHGGVYAFYEPTEAEVYLAGWFKNNSNVLQGWRYRLSDGASDTTAGPTIAATADQQASEEQFEDSIFFYLDNATMYAFNAITKTWDSFINPGGFTPSLSSDYCVAPDGNLYFVSIHPTFGQGCRLLRYTGAWSDVYNYSAIQTTAYNNRQNSRIGVFSDGTDLYAFAFNENAGTNGWRCFRIPDPFDGTGVSHITTTVLPASLRSSADGGTATSSGDKRMAIIQDTESTPGTLRTFLAFADNDSTSTWAVYEWQGPGSAMTSVGTGGAVRDALPAGVTSGGARFFTSGQLYVRILSAVKTLGGELLSFVAYGGGTRTVKFRYGASQQSAVNQATLAGSATGGGTRVGNEVQGVSADGSTVNTIVWALGSDGFNGGESGAVLVPEIVA